MLTTCLCVDHGWSSLDSAVNCWLFKRHYVTSCTTQQQHHVHACKSPQDLQQPGLLGSALLQLLLDRQAALPFDVEADVLLAASHCFSRAVWFDGCDVLQELTLARVRAYAAERDSRPLVKIVTGRRWWCCAGVVLSLSTRKQCTAHYLLDM